MAKRSPTLITGRNPGVTGKVIRRRSSDESERKQTSSADFARFARFFNPRSRGFFGDIQSPFARGEVIVEDGQVQTGDRFRQLDFKGGRRRGLGVARQITEQAAQQAESQLKEQGLTGKKGVNFRFRVGGASGRSASLGQGLFVGGRGTFKRGAERTGLFTQEEFNRAIADLVGEQVSPFLPESTQQGTQQPVAGTLTGEAEMTPEERRRTRIPRRTDPAIEEARRSAIREERERTGRQSTILTSGRGVTEPLGEVDRPRARRRSNPVARERIPALLGA